MEENNIPTNDIDIDDERRNINNVFESDIFDVMNQLKETSNSSSEYMIEMVKNFSEKSKIFSQDIYDFIQKKALEYKNIFNLENNPENKDKAFNPTIGLKISTKKTIKLIKKITELYSQIFESLKQNLEIMLKFLDISKSIHKMKPIQEFLYDNFSDITNCWLFMKLDFENFDFNEEKKNSEIDPTFKTLLTNLCNNKYSSIKIIQPQDSISDKKFKEKIDTEINLLSGNQSNLLKLYIENIEDLSKVINNNFQFKKLKSFYLKNSEKKLKKLQCNINDNLFQKMPNLEKLTIRQCMNININLITKFPEKLKKLYLEENKFKDKDFNYILEKVLINNKNILQNLELLSFENNNLTYVDLSQIPQKCIFQSLIELNFSKNRLYKFIFNNNSKNFKKLKFINCCNNNFNKSFLNDYSKIIGLESGNLFMLDSELKDTYYFQLKDKLIKDRKDPYRMSYLNITYIPTIKSINYFNDFNINENIMIYLKKLDLSYNGLTCDTFFKFIEQNKGFINLRTLKLKGNNLDDTFFEKYSENDTIFHKLDHLYLDSNNIGDNETKINYKNDISINKSLSGGNEELVYKLRLIYKFIEKNKFLTKLTITKNPISHQYTKKPIDNPITIKEYIEKDKDDKIIINCLYSFLVKIRDELVKKGDKKIGRTDFNIKFDIQTNVNQNSEDFPLNNFLIIYKNN